MMHKPSNILILFFLAVFTGCTPKEDLKSLKEDTEAIHDEAMKDLADMNRVKRRIKKEMEGLDSLSVRLDSFRRVVADMEAADAYMMSWMSAYKDPAGMPEKEATVYLKEQREKISKNRDDIKAALESGKAMLNE